MTKTGEKGYLLEELLRAYFLRAGLFAVRGVPLQIDGDDLTDVDIWLYERPTGSFRRRQIVDAKSKLKPKAVERLFWTKGLLELLQVDGAYIATTDTRPILQEISSKLGVQVLDGTDLKRISESEKVLIAERISEEELDKSIKSVDRKRRSKNLQQSYMDLKAGLIDDFGAGTANRMLGHFSSFSQILSTSHPNSEAAATTLRLAYIAASLVAISLDFSLSKVSFKTVEERRKKILNIIRYGHESETLGMEKVRIAAALVERYSENGRAISQSMLNAIQHDFQSIPAEVIADHVLTQLKGDSLFRIARLLEFEGFQKELKGFDHLPSEVKSFLGMLMDFGGHDRSTFAKSWEAQINQKADSNSTNELGNNPSGSLFES